MKGLVVIPSIELLATAYGKLQSGFKIEISELALWSQWARLDPRLAEQWVDHLEKNWREISPLEFRTAALKQPWPASVGLLLEHALLLGRDRKKFGAQALFRAWCGLVTEGMTRADDEQFFVGLRAFAGKAMIEDAVASLKLYRKWGYLGREILFNKAALRIEAAPRTLLSVSARRQKLDEFLDARQRLTTREYRELLGGCVGVRQAEVDLASHPRLKPVGRTRGRVWVIK